MIPICAKQGVEKKISFEDFLSAMLSDYECAYACGLAARILGAAVSASVPLSKVKETVDSAIRESDAPEDYRTKNLYRMITDYTLEKAEEQPEEIPLLLQMGLESTFLDKH